MNARMLGLFLLIMGMQYSYAQPTETIKSSTANTSKEKERKVEKRQEKSKL